MVAAGGKRRKGSEKADLVAAGVIDAERAFWQLYDDCIEQGLGKQPSDGLPWDDKALALRLDEVRWDEMRRSVSNWRNHKNIPADDWGKRLAGLFYGGLDGDGALRFLLARHAAWCFRQRGKGGRGKGRKGSSATPPSLDLLCSNVETLVRKVDNRVPRDFRLAVVEEWLAAVKLGVRLAAAGDARCRASDLGDLAADFIRLTIEVQQLEPDLREELADLVTLAGGIERLAVERGVTPREDGTTPTEWPFGVKQQLEGQANELARRIAASRASGSLEPDLLSMLDATELPLRRLKGELARDCPRLHIARSAAEEVTRNLRPNRHDPASSLGLLQESSGALASRLREVQEQVIRALPDLAIFRDLADSPELVVVPAGSFLMGSPEDEKGRSEREGPQHRVTVPRFALGRYPVTFEEYDRYCAAAGAEKPDDRGWGRGRRPVIYVSWEDTEAYCAWLSGETGKAYRLLSEAEWEYASRAGTETRYSWGDREPDAKLANFDANVGKTTEVGSYPANPWKLSDMHGNVDEWCEDVWHDSYEGAPEDGRAWIEGGDRYRVIRGGSWSDDARFVRSAYRSWSARGDRNGLLGFRCARGLE